MDMDTMLMLVKLLGILTAIAYMIIIKPYIEAAKAKLETEKEKVLADLTEQERQELRDSVKDAVEAAEQIMKSESGQKKKEEVMKNVAEKLSTLTKLVITTKELDDMIEAFVYAMNAAKGK